MEAKINFSIDKDFFEDLEKFSKDNGEDIEEYIIRAIKEKYEEDLRDKDFLMMSQTSLEKDWNKECEDRAWNNM